MEDVAGTCQAKPTKVRELFLDTKGSCFLCLNEVPAEVKEGMTEVCLRNICHYLDINPCSILLKSLKETLLNEGVEPSSQNEKCDFSVKLCVTCSALTKKLSELICTAEMTRILMNHNLKVFNQILIASHQNTDSVKKKIISSSDNPVEACLVEQLRLEVKEKCSRKIPRLLSMDLPKVRIERLATANQSKDDILVTDNTHRKITSKLSQAHGNVKEVHTRKNVSRSKARNKAESAPLLDIPAEKLLSEILSKSCTKGPGHGKYNLKNSYVCRICKNFKGAYSKSIILKHMANRHPETFFVHTKTYHNLPEEEFKKGCQHIFRKVRSMGTPTGKRLEFLCPFCRSKCRDIINLGYHLMFEHYKILEEKVNSMENESDDQLSHHLSNSLGEKPEDSTGDNPIRKAKNNKQKVCNSGHKKQYDSVVRTVGQRTIRSAKLYRNKNQKRKVWPCNETAEGDGCGRIFSCNWDLTRHKMDHCPKRKTKNVWICSAGEDDGGCGKVLSSKWHLMRHIRHSCSTRIVRDYRKCSEADGGCGKTFSSNWHLIRHIKNSCTTRTDRDIWTCSEADGGCGRTFSSTAFLYRHQRAECHINPHQISKSKGRLEILKSQQVIVDGNSFDNYELAEQEMENIDQNALVSFEIEESVSEEDLLGNFHVESEEVADMCTIMASPNIETCVETKVNMMNNAVVGQESLFTGFYT